MPRYDQTAEQIEAETDRLLLEQAQAFIRDMRAAAQNAPYGKVIQRADAFAVQNGREFARNVLETIIQEQNDLLEKKETRQCTCGGDRKHLGYAAKAIVSVSGEFQTNRIYRRCAQCGITIYPTDEMLGLEERYTVGLRD